MTDLPAPFIERTRRLLGDDYPRFADLFAAITREEAQDLIARWVTPERTALAVIRPKGEAK